MGQVRCKFEFNKGSIPSLDSIVEFVTQLTGLKVIVVKQFEDEFNEYSADLAFEEFPTNYFTISANRPDELNISFMQETEAEHHDLKKEQIIEKFNPIPMFKKQKVQLVVGLGQEPTLFEAISLSLKELGGKSENQFNGNNAEKIQFPITRNELIELHKKHDKTMFWLKFKILLMIPIMIPVYIIAGIIGLIKMPFEMNQTYKKVKKEHPEFFENKRGPND